MIDQTELTRGRAIVERWCVLAEQRLDHLTELFETGRWRRYFGEVEFLENIQEAKRAVATWRALIEREAASDNRPVDLSWLGRRPVPPRLISMVAKPRISARPGFAERRGAASASPSSQPAPEPEAGQAAMASNESWTRALDPEILQQRYPLLRNAM